MVLHHGCCWETFYICAYCGLVVEIPTELLRFKICSPSNVNQESGTGQAKREGVWQINTHKQNAHPGLIRLVTKSMNLLPGGSCPKRQTRKPRL